LLGIDSVYAGMDASWEFLWFGPVRPVFGRLGE